jgi:hypothetical protein
VDGDVCIPNQISYGGYTGFVGATYNIWYDLWYGWVVSKLPIGSPLYEYWQYDTPIQSTEGQHYGSAFCSFAALSFPQLGRTVDAYGQGTLNDSDYAGGTSTYKLTIGTTWEYWQTGDAETLYGKYSPKGEASEDIYFGSPQWKNGTTKYCRTPASVSGKFDYGDIVWNDDASKYILGSYNSVAGWHESSSAPSIESSWTLSFAKPEDSEAEGSSITLEWDDWALGTYTKTISVIRASKWDGGED